MNSGQLQKKQSKARPRGRPRKEATDEPLKDKRARGREAQKNYMARKQAETHRLKNRIASLDRTVEAIVTEFIHFGHRRVNSSQVLNCLPLLDDLKQTTARILDHARTAESCKGNGAGNFSPRLGYGVLNNTSQVRAADEFLSHYCVSGPNSFAFRLYRDTIILSIRILQGELSVPGFIPSLMRYRFRYEKSDNYITDASDFLQKLSLQTPAMDGAVKEASGTEDENGIVLFGPSHPVMTSGLRVTMYQDLIEEVGSIREWLDPYDTQLYLRDQWGFTLTGSTARFFPTSIYRHREMRSELETGHFESYDETPYNIFQEDTAIFAEEAIQILPAQLLAQSLIWKSVCFGEGPRFYKKNIDATAAEFLARYPIHQLMFLPDLIQEGNGLYCRCLAADDEALKIFINS
ncbi:hypothetical protein N431DRAFT_496467 [Stipitochalara longipes BDJ]|nr:hypothetical protein N431DRAFT_496467 [Stipitochalara longipes BDJ]